MYSLMSIRTIAASSSNRNSASARAVSVLPTPVGPRKINDPIGRFGSLSPARDRRIAFATALSASSCPTTRSRRRSSICTSFCISPSSIFDTGMPVHFDTIAAISSSSTSSFNIRRGCFVATEPGAPGLASETWVSQAPPSAASSATAASCASVSLRSSASAFGISPYCSSAARCRLPLRVSSIC